MSTEASLRAEIKTFLRAERSGHALSEVLVEEQDEFERERLDDDSDNCIEP